MVGSGLTDHGHTAEIQLPHSLHGAATSPQETLKASMAHHDHAIVTSSSTLLRASLATDFSGGLSMVSLLPRVM